MFTTLSLMFKEYSVLEDLAFVAIVLVLLVINLKIHRDGKLITIKDAAIWSVIWIMAALFFAVYIMMFHGAEGAGVFLTGYLIEKTLSIDNLFVIMAVFTAFRIEERYQHRVLYYGILLAIVLRGIFIMAGAAVLEMGGKFVFALFGLMVLYSAWKMMQSSNSPQEVEVDYTKHPIIKLFSKFFPIHPRIENQNFFTKKPFAGSSKNGTVARQRWHATPLFLCLMTIEFVDVVFALDSVPAIFAITDEPFLVYSASISAILGMRSLYFLIVAAKRYLCHMEKSVFFVLLFIGVQMVLEPFAIIEIPPIASLCSITGIIATGVVTSLISGRKRTSFC